jgi:hypothetical protein
MMSTQFPRPFPAAAMYNPNARQPHVIQPVGHGGLNANREPAFKNSPVARLNPLQRKPQTSR